MRPWKKGLFDFLYSLEIDSLGRKIHLFLWLVFKLPVVGSCNLWHIMLIREALDGYAVILTKIAKRPDDCSTNFLYVYICRDPFNFWIFYIIDTFHFLSLSARITHRRFWKTLTWAQEYDAVLSVFDFNNLMLEVKEYVIEMDTLTRLVSNMTTFM